MAVVIQKEIKGLDNKHTWDIVLVRNFPSFANVLSRRFLLTIKDDGSKNETWKASSVAQYHKDNMNFSLLHNISIARQYSTKIFISIAAIKKLRFFSTNINQAYIRSEEKLQRENNFNPSNIFGLEFDNC